MIPWIMQQCNWGQHPVSAVWCSDMCNTMSCLVLVIQTLGPDFHLNSFVLWQAQAYGKIWLREKTMFSTEIRIRRSKHLSNDWVSKKTEEGTCLIHFRNNSSFGELALFAVFPRVRWEDQYHFQINIFSEILNFKLLLTSALDWTVSDQTKPNVLRWQKTKV